MPETSTQTHDRILWILSERGGSIAKGQIARKLHMKIEELDPILRELERAGKVRLAEVKGKLVVELKVGQCL